MSDSGMQASRRGGTNRNNTNTYCKEFWKLPSNFKSKLTAWETWYSNGGSKVQCY